jgi:hypothetical protein
MTLENCLIYLEEAKDEDTKKFWQERIDRKYPKPKEVKKVKKVVKEVKEVKE